MYNYMCYVFLYVSYSIIIYVSCLIIIYCVLSYILCIIGEFCEKVNSHVFFQYVNIILLYR